MDRCMYYYIFAVDVDFVRFFLLRLNIFFKIQIFFHRLFYPLFVLLCKALREGLARRSIHTHQSNRAINLARKRNKVANWKLKFSNRGQRYQVFMHAGTVSMLLNSAVSMNIYSGGDDPIKLC